MSVVLLTALAAGCSFGGSTRAHATTTAALASGHQPCPTEDASMVVRLVNDVRKRSGRRLLGTDTYLARFAGRRSAAMAAESRLSHRGWDAALRKAGLADDALGENVAYNYATPEAVMRGWMQSPGHRANIL
ncbi:MAG: CAP domain-containing protein, partial [Candidatus Binatia bacterium]